MDYTFAVRGDGEVPTAIIAPGEQRRALKAVLATLDPRVLALPESLLKIIPPRPVMYPRGREDFKIRTTPAFDAVAPAEAAAQLIMQFLFNPQRAARLEEFHARDAANPGLAEVIDQILKSMHAVVGAPGYLGEIGRTVDSIAIYDLMQLANDTTTLPDVRAIASAELRSYKEKNAERIQPACRAGRSSSLFCVRGATDRSVRERSGKSCGGCALRATRRSADRRRRRFLVHSHSARGPIRRTSRFCRSVPSGRPCALPTRR